MNAVRVKTFGAVPQYFLPVLHKREIYYTELNDFRKIICLRNSEVSVERIVVCNHVIENLAEHGENEHGVVCLPCSYTNDVIDIHPNSMMSH